MLSAEIKVAGAKVVQQLVCRDIRFQNWDCLDWGFVISARPGATPIQIDAAGAIFEIHSLKRLFFRIGLGQGRLGMKSGKRSIL